MANIFITTEEAKILIKEHCQTMSPASVLLNDALHTVLAEDIYSPLNIPAFDQSAMDGYAIAFDDYCEGKSLHVAGESFAGITSRLILKKNTAIRIFTGAPLPAGADTVVMQEHVKTNGDEIKIETTQLIKGQHVRCVGAEIKQCMHAMQKGELLTPAAIGFLAGLGLTEVKVYSFPRVSIITTGKEIVQPGNPLQFGQVYESNSITLKTALHQLHIKDISLVTVDDDMQLLQAAVNNALQKNDVVLITGGVSVGDHDLVPQALINSGVEIIFHKVKQRPGKPLLFGKKGNCIVFGLPGNPSSVLSCYYNYVLPALQACMKRQVPFIETRMMKLLQRFEKQIPLTQFLKGKYSSDEVDFLGAQESFRLSSFAVANCLIEIPAQQLVTEAGELVKVHLI